MINLNQKAEPECVRWMDRVTTGVTGYADTGYGGGGGASSGKELRTPRKNSFQPRYGNFLHPDYALLYPSNFHREKPYDHEEEEYDDGPPPPPQNKPASRSLLTSNAFNRMKTTPLSSSPSCPPILSAPDNKLCLCEDVLQRCKGGQQTTEKAMPRCLGVFPKSDSSVIKERDDSVRVDTLDKAVMTDDSALEITRNSCPLVPPKDELCECEKPIFENKPVRGKVIYENDEQMFSSSTRESNEAFTRNVVAFNENYRRNHLRDLLSSENKKTFKSLLNLRGGTETVSTSTKLSSSRRSSSETSLYSKDSTTAECSKCGNRFNVDNGVYFNAPLYEHVSSSSTTTTSDSTDETSSSSGHDESKSEVVGDRDRKLTKEEREIILKELEEIISGEFFSKGTKKVPTAVPNATSIPSSLLHLNLNELKDSESSSEANSVTSPTTVGRVAELTKHFSKLGEAAIFRTCVKTKSVPNISCPPENAPVRYSSVGAFPENNIRLTELNEEASTEAAPLRNECSRRRQSFARQDTVFCKMKSVDELDQKNSSRKNKLYKYASLADFRSPEDKTESNGGQSEREKKKIASADNLTPLISESQQTYEDSMKMNYDKMTTAIRDYLANKELLLKRMKSNSMDNFGTSSRSLANLNKTCPNFTSVRDYAEERHDGPRVFKAGMSLDTLWTSSPINLDEEDDFIFKDSIRRVYKGPYLKSRRFRNCRKLGSRRSVLIFSGETLSRGRITRELKSGRSMQARCQSLDTAMDRGGRGSSCKSVVEPSRNL